jgi:hypothetical protein
VVRQPGSRQQGGRSHGNGARRPSDAELGEEERSEAGHGQHAEEWLAGAVRAAGGWGAHRSLSQPQPLLVCLLFEQRRLQAARHLPGGAAADEGCMLHG